MSELKADSLSLTSGKQFKQFNHRHAPIGPLAHRRAQQPAGRGDPSITQTNQPPTIGKTMTDIDTTTDTANSDMHIFKVILDQPSKRTFEKVTKAMCTQLGLPIRKATAFRLLVNQAAKNLNIAVAA
jgi:hypothetical protein